MRVARRHYVTHIVSGGQTGADQGGLEAARELGLSTFGFMPRGYVTEDGPRRDIAEKFGLRAVSGGYPKRTMENVKAADATVTFGGIDSPGSALTKRCCEDQRKKFMHIFWSPMVGFYNDSGELRRWLIANKVGILNVAGNRESKQPGIQAATKAFLIQTLKT